MCIDSRVVFNLSQLHSLEIYINAIIFVIFSLSKKINFLINVYILNEKRFFIKHSIFSDTIKQNKCEGGLIKILATGFCLFSKKIQSPQRDNDNVTFPHPGSLRVFLRFLRLLCLRGVCLIRPHDTRALFPRVS